MKGIGNIMFATALALLPVFFSCEKEAAESSAVGTRLSLNAVIEEPGLQIETKGSYFEGPSFSDSDCIRLIILAEGSTTDAFQTGYDNIKATLIDSNHNIWNFNYGGKDTSALVLTPRPDKKRAVVYAFAPYYSGTPTAIPVKVSDDLDFMYAKPKGGTVIDPGAQSEVTLNLNFDHLLSRIRFKLRLENSGSDQRWDYVELRRKSAGSTDLYQQGTFNALTGTITLDSKADSIRIDCGGVQLSAAQADSCEMLLLPVAPYNEGSYSVVFGIDGIAYEHVISESDVKHVGIGSTLDPFQPGYMYTFDFTLDNYVHFKGVTRQGWSNGTGFGHTVSL